MSDAKLAIVFYSTYGTNHAMALEAADAAREAGAEVRLVRAPETAPQDVIDQQEPWKAQQEKMADIPEATADDMEWANAYLFIGPTRFGVIASQIRSFIDTLGGLWQNGALANKPVSAMTSAQNPHGGMETTLLSLYVTFMHWGGIIVAPGYTDQSVFDAGGNPYGTVTTAGNVSDEAKAAARHQVRRLVEYADKLA
ncbi:NAD(P)H:quinone oxidoreductase [Gymnodinialimonas sp. 57CJ19]|uniref:NAD(P)H:quinone oxidoreductase n=1 Tax=Gymnodinialimonas sp. 57CJ19 TaxID=3138498 RepID=UPI0031342B91